AQVQLAATREEAAARQRHAAHYLAFAERAMEAVAGARVWVAFGSPSQVAWFARLEQEHDNLRLALAWAAEQGAAEALVRFGAALWWFWTIRGHLAEGRRWLEAALGHGEATPSQPRARALCG